MPSGQPAAFNWATPRLTPSRSEDSDATCVMGIRGIGAAWRGRRLKELSLARERPPEADHRRGQARQRFEEASRQFAAAAAAFSRRAQPADHDWLVRARCDDAEMLLRVQKPKEALDRLGALL